jgi:hypothetical protein
MVAFYVIKEYERAVVLRLGKITGEARGPGLIFVAPFVQRIHRVSLRIITMPIQSQGIITKDNVTIDVSGVAYYRVADPIRSVVAIGKLGAAINQIAQTTLRAVVGRHTLDETLSETDAINQNIREIQTLVEVAVDKNSTVVFPAPLMSTIAELGAFLAGESKAAAELPSTPDVTTNSTNGALVPHDRYQPA